MDLESYIIWKYKDNFIEDEDNWKIVDYIDEVGEY